MQPSLLLSAPPGFLYEPDFIDEAEEARLIEGLESLRLVNFEFHGLRTKRRVAHFGLNYGYNSRRVTPGEPMPGFLEPLRSRIAAWTGEPAEAFAEVLVTQYTPGAGIGWHRDAPGFDKVVGVSLAADCSFRFRRGEGASAETRRLVVARRSAYLIDGESRWEWQHHIPPSTRLRYSITMRTLQEAQGTPSAGSQ